MGWNVTVTKSANPCQCCGDDCDCNVFGQCGWFVVCDDGPRHWELDENGNTCADGGVPQTPPDSYMAPDDCTDPHDAPPYTTHTTTCCCPGTKCCPDNPVPYALTATFSGQTGYATTISPNPVTLVRDGSYGGPGAAVWIGKVGFDRKDGTGSTYHIEPFDIRVACAGNYPDDGVYKWYNLDGGATNLVTGDGRSAASASCDPLNLVFHEDKPPFNPSDPMTGMAYTMTVTAGMSGLSVMNVDTTDDGPEDTTEDGKLTGPDKTRWHATCAR